MTRGMKNKLNKILTFYGVGLSVNCSQKRYVKVISREFGFTGVPKSIFRSLILKYEIENPDKKLRTLKAVKDKKPTYRHEAQDFYKSTAWRSLRYDVLKEQGAKCQLCGRGRKHDIVLHCDHIMPLSKDWSKRLDKDNIQVLCDDCNLGKSNKDSIDWR